MGAKYIIELEEKPLEETIRCGIVARRLYRVKGFNTLVFDQNGLDKLKPYTKPNLERVKEEAYDDGYDDGYKTAKIRGDIQTEKNLREVGMGHYHKGLNDMWEATKKLSIMSSEEAEKVFPGAGRFNRFNLGYSGEEAYEKITEYERKQTEEAEYKVGDEVTAKTQTYEDTPKGCVVYPNKGQPQCLVITSNGTMAWWHKEALKKTGRSFPQISEVLKEMRGQR